MKPPRKEFGVRDLERRFVVFVCWKKCSLVIEMFWLTYVDVSLNGGTRISHPKF